MVTITGVMPVQADQPEMREALAALRNARGHLEHALHNKGGERERALKHVDEAIHEVEAGMAIGRGR